MTQEQKRILIAEACGWKWARKEPDRLPAIVEGWLNPVTKDLHAEPPDYFNDLNAMHEAERVLTPDQLIQQAEWIGACSNEMPMKSWVVLMRSTAAQRAESFGKALNLW